MSQKEIQRKLGIQRRKPESKEPPQKKQPDPKARRNQYIFIAVALLGLVAFYFIQRGGGQVSAQVITPADYQSQYVEANADHLLVDVRTPEEFAEGHIAGAVNIPLDALESRLGEVPTDKPVVLYCRSGNRSAQAATLLKEAGYTQVRDLGGLSAWTAAGYAVE